VTPTDETEERMTYAEHAASCPTCDTTLCPEGRELPADAVQCLPVPGAKP
jgi:hypothetical protein